MSKRQHWEENDNRVTTQKAKRQKTGVNEETLSGLGLLPEEIWGYIINYQCDRLERFVMMYVCKTFCNLLNGKRMYKKYRSIECDRGIICQNRGKWIHDAAKKGYLGLARWMLTINSFMSTDMYYYNALSGAVKGGNAETMQSLLNEIGGQLKADTFGGILDSIVIYGRSDLLGKVEEMINGICESGEELKANAWNKILTCKSRIVTAGFAGKVDVLNWYEIKTSITTHLGPLFLTAARNGHLNVLNWVMERKNKEPKDPGFKVLFEAAKREAARYKHLHVLKWYAERGKHLMYKGVFRNCCGWAEEETLRWLKEDMRCPTVGTSTLVAIRGGNFRGLKWMIKNGWHLSGDSCSEAVRVGRLDILKWCLKKGVTWKVSIVDMRHATMGTPEMLQFLIEYGNVDWGIHWTLFAVMERNIPVLNWIKEREYDWKDARLYDAAPLSLKMCNAGSFGWLLDNGCPFNLNSLLKRICGLQKEEKYKHAFRYGEKLKEKCKRISASIIAAS